MSSFSVEQQTDSTIMVLPALVQVFNDDTGLQVLSEDGLPVEISVDDTDITITDAMVELASSDVSVTAEAAVEIEAGADFDLTVGGATEVESSDITVTAAAVEVETGLFTVE